MNKYKIDLALITSGGKTEGIHTLAEAARARTCS
jgi:hypothetical protein